jgi:hypothetical protein
MPVKVLSVHGPGNSFIARRVLFPKKKAATPASGGEYPDQLTN